MAEPIVNNQTAPSLEAISGIESLGQADGVEVFTTTAQTAKNWYAIYFVTESVISAITSNQAANVSALVTTIPAGMTLFMRIQSITLTSGLAIGYEKY
jgi:hypothetical protein|tara:strand:- start:1595 stop:1888 length:294 start_codon:yes stop_codon:yes gene_type:complete